jgi:predicted DNA-binding transcriptional regulator AlpA
MKVSEFAIVASGLDPNADDFEDRFFEAGCDDATIVVKRGAIILEFAREADSLSDAIESAIASVRRAGAEIVRIEPDNLVSLSEIAERSGLTRAAISNYAKGERGKEFPRPVARVTSESPLWDWTDVAAWLRARGQIEAGALADARAIKVANDSLESQQRRRRHYA